MNGPGAEQKLGCSLKGRPQEGLLDPEGYSGLAGRRGGGDYYAQVAGGEVTRRDSRVDLEESGVVADRARIEDFRRIGFYGYRGLRAA